MYDDEQDEEEFEDDFDRGPDEAGAAMHPEPDDDPDASLEELEEEPGRHITDNSEYGDEEDIRDEF